MNSSTNPNNEFITFITRTLKENKDYISATNLCGLMLKNIPKEFYPPKGQFNKWMSSIKNLEKNDNKDKDMPFYKWKEEITNLKNDYTRNLIRNQLIPQMETIYPNVNQQILDTISRLKEAEDIVDATVTAFWKKHISFPKGIPTIDLSKVSSLSTNITYSPVTSEIPLFRASDNPPFFL
jgi:hypothetical protein